MPNCISMNVLKTKETKQRNLENSQRVMTTVLTGDYWLEVLQENQVLKPTLQYPKC